MKIRDNIKKWLAYDYDLDAAPVMPDPVEPDVEAPDISFWRSLRRRGAHRALYYVAAVICSIILASTLILTVSGMPRYGEDAEFMDTVTYEYLAHGMEYTGAVNIVSGIILEYRAFDTLGESFVLFCAVTCVLVLLRIDDGKDDVSLPCHDLTGDVILSRTMRALIPFIFIFGIYVLLNGHLSPGGGFSGGAVLGAGIILLSSAYGEKTSGKFVTERTFRIVTTSALLFYCVGKSYTFYTGANGLHSFIGNGTPGNILSAGLILPLNVAVGLVVACTMYGIYRMFKERRF